jgi:hypothetical protein
MNLNYCCSKISRVGRQQWYIPIGPRPVFLSKEIRSFMLFTTSEICKTNACLGNVALLSSPNKTNKEDALAQPLRCRKMHKIPQDQFSSV